jgi:hypothetical protein
MRVQRQMIHKNLSPLDYDFILNFTAEWGETGDVYEIDFNPNNLMSGSLGEEWGAGSALESVRGPFSCNIYSETQGLGTYKQADFTFGGTPVYSYSGAGMVSTGYWRIIITGAYLVVNPDCTYYWGGASMQAYLSINGGAEIPAISYGPFSYNAFFLYDETNNCTGIAAAAGSGDGDDSGILYYSWDNGVCYGGPTDDASIYCAVTATGGYKRAIAGADAVQFDTTAPPGTCPSLTALPTVSGADSYNVQVAFTQNAGFTVADYYGPGDWTVTVNFLETYANQFIRDKNTPTGPFSTAGSWQCIPNPWARGDLGNTTSGSTSSTDSNPAYTTCTGTRGVASMGSGEYSDCDKYPLSTGFEYEAYVTSSWSGSVPCYGAPTANTNLAYYQSDDGESHLATVTNTGDIRYRWSNFPTPPWITDFTITTGGGWVWLAIAVDEYNQIELWAAHINQGGSDPLSTGVYRMWSTDSGTTFGPLFGGALSPVQMVANGIQTQIRTDGQGGTLTVSLVPDTGTSGPGTLWGCYRGVGDAGFGSAYQLVDNTNTPLHSDGTGFQFDICAEDANQWALAMVKDGDTDVSIWYSPTYDGSSWTEFT